ncbi:hypothetical protein KHQ89_01820 [Mycoplasmatota bacterium]|nr:hypothetical protein KHQ89_01820 [Mycoplasmatota bacterium]
MYFTKKVLITLWVIGTFTISIIIAYVFKKDLGKIYDWFVVIPNVVTVELLIYWIFTQYLWKWKRLYPRVVPFPNLTGTWIGKLNTSFSDPEKNSRIKEINCMLVIIHKYRSIHITFITKESKSHSYSEKLIFDNTLNYKQITYNYANNPKLLLDKRSSNHRGTAILSLIDKNILEGEYYTDRETKGEIYFEFKCKESLSKLPNEVNKHPMDKM